MAKKKRRRSKRWLMFHNIFRAFGLAKALKESRLLDQEAACVVAAVVAMMI